MKRFLVWCFEDGETEASGATQISARDAAEAVEEWADQDDWGSAEYSIVGGTPKDVLVRDLHTGAITAWRVVGEAVRTYTATEREPFVQPKAGAQ